MDAITYAIGDIHGRRDLLDSLLDQIELDAAARRRVAKIVFCGDYVDRGPDFRGVIEKLIAGPRRPCDQFVCLAGNHDHLFVRAVTTDQQLPDWAWSLFLGTLASYDLGGKPDNAALRRHADFLSALPLTHDDGERLFVHAGIRPGVPLEEQVDEDLTWIREEFLYYPHPLPRLVVHGHTIMGDQPVVTRNRVSIDTGAFMSGILTAAAFDGGRLRFLQAVGEAVAWAA